MMPDTQLMITIERTQPSQSGKTLSVLSNDRWYSTKHFELANWVGQSVMALTSENDYNGKPMYWINDYTAPTPGHQIPQQTMPDGQVQGVSVPAMPQAQQVTASIPPPVNPAPAPMAPPKTVDRDASIVAQTLCKTIQFSSVDAAFAAYVGLYELVKEWQATGRTPQAEANEMPHQDIPF